MKNRQIGQSQSAVNSLDTGLENTTACRVGLGLGYNSAKSGVLLLGALAVGCSGEMPGDTDEFVTQESAITNGNLATEADQQQNRFAATVKMSIFGGFCSAVKISETRFLTAAHCMLEAGVLRPGDTVSLTNRLDANMSAADSHAFMLVEEVFLHPSYAAKENPDLAYDIAIVQLDPTRATSNIPVVEVVGSAYAWDGSWGQLISYGSDEADSAHSGRKQYGSFQTYTRSSSPPGAYFDSIHVHNIVTFTPGIDSAKGDSGGPLFIRHAGVPKLFGIHTSGSDPENGFGSSQVRVSNVRRWIDNPEATNVFSDGEQGFLLNGSNGRCIGLQGDSRAAGTAAMVDHCDGRNQPVDDQYWRLEEQGNGSFRLRSTFSGRCLDITNNTNRVAQYNCDSRAAQQWRFSLQSNLKYNIINGETGQCLAPPSGSLPGDQLAVRDCPSWDKSSLKTWVFHP